MRGHVPGSSKSRAIRVSGNVRGRNPAAVAVGGWHEVAGIDVECLGDK